MSEKALEVEASNNMHLFLNKKYLKHITGKDHHKVALKTKLPKEEKHGMNTLDIVVDTHGRANFGETKKQMHDVKGLWSANLDHKALNSGEDGQWSICALRFEDSAQLSKVAKLR